ncbi:MAG: ABC transporter permease, partial [Gemmatimonadota bacterium]
MRARSVERGAEPLPAQVYRALLRPAYPRSFRDAYGDEMQQLFRDRLRDTRRSGGATRHLTLWRHTLGDLLASGLRVRCRTLADSARRWRRGRRGGKENRRGRGSRAQTLIQDIRYAARTLRKARGFTVVAVLTVGLGIGANTAIFSVLNGIVLTPLPYHEPNRLVRVWPERVLSKQSLVEFQQQTQSYSGLSGVTWETLTLTGGGEPEELWGARVSVNHFDLLGVAPALGRVFLPEEREPGRGDVVILSHGLWTRRFGADPGIIGQTVHLGGADAASRTVIGVLAAGSHTPWEACDAWLPLTIDPTNSSDYSGTASLAVFGRLAAGVSIEQA